VVGLIALLKAEQLSRTTSNVGKWILSPMVILDALLIGKLKIVHLLIGLVDAGLLSALESLPVCNARFVATKTKSVCCDTLRR